MIGAGTPTASMTASRVFSPSPELMITVSASGSSWPPESSLRSTPRVTPPAVSPKMPSVAAAVDLPVPIRPTLEAFQEAVS